jgi:hypothetical protein
MSYSKYKSILIVFAVSYCVFAICDKYVNIASIPKYTVLFTSWLLLGLSLFFFLLYAQKVSIKDYNGRLAPSKLLPSVSVWLIFAAIAYLICMAVTYKIGGSHTDKYHRVEKGLKDTVNNNKSAASRVNAAADYYIYFGKEIYYVDERNQNKLYTPDKASMVERMKYIAFQKESRKLKMFMLYSSILSFLSGVFVAVFYFRYRKVVKPDSSRTTSGDRMLNY